MDAWELDACLLLVTTIVFNNLRRVDRWIDGTEEKRLFLLLVRLLSVNWKCNYENLIELSGEYPQ